MKIIIDYLRGFIRKDFSFTAYMSSIVLLIVGFVLSYEYSLYRVIVWEESQLLKSLYLLGLFAIPYFIVLLLKVKNSKETFFNKRSFIYFFIIFGALLLNSLTKSSVMDITKYISWDNRYNEWLFIINISLHKVIILSLPAFIYFLIYKDREVFGFKTKDVNLRIYFYMLLVMLLPILIASYSDSFLRVYPRYKPGILESSGLLLKYQSIAIAESFYGLRFIGVELFFRGLMIIGAIRFIGRHAVLPTAVLYSIWHFGKPMGEAIGAFFGAYILGVLAYRTKSIVGGIIIHLGVAFLMELFAFLQLFDVI